MLTSMKHSLNEQISWTPSEYWVYRQASFSFVHLLEFNGNPQSPMML